MQYASLRVASTLLAYWVFPCQCTHWLTGCFPVSVRTDLLVVSLSVYALAYWVFPCQCTHWLTGCFPVSVRIGLLSVSLSVYALAYWVFPCQCTHWLTGCFPVSVRTAKCFTNSSKRLRFENNVPGMHTRSASENTLLTCAEQQPSNQGDIDSCVTRRLATPFHVGIV
jgi:hypothetical protein